MVAEQHFGAAAGGLGLRFEIHQQIEHLPDRAATVEIVAGLHEGGRAARPFPIGADEAGGLQDGGERVAGAVNVADRNHARRLRT